MMQDSGYCFQDSTSTCVQTLIQGSSLNVISSTDNVTVTKCTHIAASSIPCSLPNILTADSQAIRGTLCLTILFYLTNFAATITSDVQKYHCLNYSTSVYLSLVINISFNSGRISVPSGGFNGFRGIHFVVCTIWHIRIQHYIIDVLSEGPCILEVNKI